MAEELLALADRLVLRECLFMGHAIGGVVGLHASLLRQGPILGQVLVNAWSRPSPYIARYFDLRERLLQGGAAAAYVHSQASFLYSATGSPNTASGCPSMRPMLWRTFRVRLTCGGASARCWPST